MHKRIWYLCKRMNDMDLYVKRFEELSAGELYDILQLRVAVFVVEQQCAYQELDGKRFLCPSCLFER